MRSVDSEVPATNPFAADMSSGLTTNSFLENIHRVIIIDGPEKDVCQQSLVLRSKHFLIRQTWQIRTLWIVSSGCLSEHPFIFVVSVA